MISDLEIEFHLEQLLPLLQEKVNKHFRTHRYKQPIIIGKSFLHQRKPRKIFFKEGRKYYKLILEEHGSWGGRLQTAYGFIRKGDGAILKSSSWSKPETRTKGAIRGYIMDEDAASFFEWYGVVHAF